MFPVDSKSVACRRAVLKQRQCFFDLCGLCAGKTDACHWGVCFHTLCVFVHSGYDGNMFQLVDLDFVVSI